jgi:hypothetical protein
MSTFASPSDPIFYVHHAFVDKIFEDWRLCWNYTDISQVDIGYDSDEVLLYSNNVTSRDIWNQSVTYQDGGYFCRAVPPVLLSICKEYGPLSVLSADEREVLSTWHPCVV